MGCGIFWQQINTLERSMKDLRRLGVSEGTDAFNALYKLRGELLRKVGFKLPREVVQIARIAGLSPGVITAWLDIESGWMAEARVSPGAPPVYRSIDVETAARIIKGDIDHELEDRLMAPDPYLGE